MYEYIKGQIVELSPTNAIIETSSIGYNLLISLQTFEDLSGKESGTLYIHQYYLKDEMPISFGFSSKEERSVFRLLVGVSGVGGNTARTILSTYAVPELQQIIATANSVMLKRVKGLGTKTAEKIIIELRDKIGNISTSGFSAGKTGIWGAENYEESLAALTLLGFKRDLSQKAVKQILEENPALSVEEIIKKALKTL